eukprot:GFUD01036814.1.p1 GENE.GFUD01036814.1~~GFUD01036814.1.p1  ORF type:complete len:243 (-),score=55.08 GFUD01036814.1:35-682(-)
MVRTIWLIVLVVACCEAVLGQNSCPHVEECVPIRSCSPVLDLLTKAMEAPVDSPTRTNIIIQVREKVCGAREDEMICCPQDDQGLEDGDTGEVRIGTFSNHLYGVGGEVYSLDSQTIMIKGFTYTGKGPDGFFLAGTSGGKPSKTGDVVLPYPYEGKHYSYEDESLPILGKFDGSEDIILSLPPGKTVNQLKWLSVWCRAYKINFGHVMFSDSIL